MVKQQNFGNEKLKTFADGKLNIAKMTISHCD